MKIQTSHTTPTDHTEYSGVYQQQGRMITDADWNALTDAEKRRLVNALRDAIAGGAPREGGLALTNTDEGITIEPGTLYVNGIPARLSGEGDGPIPLHDQPDCPSLADLPDSPVILFADVWEREVTALEDPALMDPALHGADTTTRSRTLLQVKWKPVETETDLTEASLDDWKAPAGRSNAPLKLALRKIVVGDDDCDPCASEMDLDERIGNYLFRVEIHDVFEEDNERYLTLKWSRDNGAEAHEADNVPPGFNRGNWVWEFYDTDSENSAGIYCPTNHKVRRGLLRTAFDIPDKTGDPKTFVRQWDGYLILNLDTHELIEGRDRGTELTTDGSTDAHGWTRLKDGILILNSELMEFELDYGGQKFLPGDYWQAAVRETQHSSGNYVLGSEEAGEPPRGIQHHYLPLAYLDSDGTHIKHSDEERRRFSFPPLTDLRASDVGCVTEKCNNLFHQAKNVQQALDALCEIGAEDIAYRIPEPCKDQKLTPRELLEEVFKKHLTLKKTTVEALLDTLLCHFNSRALPHELEACSREKGPSFRELLKLKEDHQPTAKILNQILCETTAQRIPLDHRAELCESLQREEVQTVQEALNALCRRDTGGGCARVVEPGQLEAVLRELIKAEAEHIWLCLKPGEHQLPKDLSLRTAQLIRITGAGYHASQITMTGEHWLLHAPEVHLRDVSIQFGDNVQGEVEINAQDVTIERFQIQSYEPQGEQRMLYIRGSEGGDLAFLSVKDSRLIARGGTALYLEQVHQRAQIQNNYITGEVLYNHAIGKPVDPDSQGIVRNSIEENRVEDARGVFIVENNSVFRWISLIESGLVGDGALFKPVTGPDTLTLTQNNLGAGSSFVGQRLSSYGNQLFGPADDAQSETTLWLFANQLMATGQIGDSPRSLGRYTAINHIVEPNLMTFESL